MSRNCSALIFENLVEHKQSTAADERTVVGFIRDKKTPLSGKEGRRISQNLEKLAKNTKNCKGSNQASNI